MMHTGGEEGGWYDRQISQRLVNKNTINPKIGRPGPLANFSGKH
jgi:hypothetical protein